MNKLIAFAPVTTMQYHDIELAKKLGDNQTFIKFLERQCPDIFEDPGAMTPLMKHVHSVSGFTQTMPLRMSVEQDPTMLSQTAAVNYGGHFPAGASFK